MKLQHKLLNSGKDLSLPAVSELLEREGSWDPEKDALRIEALKYFALTHPEERFDSSQVDVSRDPDEKHLSQMEESAECGSMPQDAFSSVQHVPDVLHFLQFGKTPEDAFRLCVALGIFSPSDVRNCVASPTSCARVDLIRVWWCWRGMVLFRPCIHSL